MGWHEQEYVLRNLNCGREYHVYVVLFNALGASPASQVLTSRTLGNRPSAPNSQYDFVTANTTFLSLRLDQWDDHNCEILYFVIEYKPSYAHDWITGKIKTYLMAVHLVSTLMLFNVSVTNDLQPQSRYSIRSLHPSTEYDLKVTAHNHAGSATMR